MQLILEPNDSKRLAKLCGQFDENLNKLKEDSASKSKIEGIFLNLMG